MRRQKQGLHGARAGLGAPGFHTAQMTLPQPRQQRQFQLAEVGLPAQLTQMLARRGLWGRGISMEKMRIHALP